MNANRRSQERKQPERMVFCKLGGDESGSVLNLSEDGLCFGSLTPIEKKDVLEVCLSVDLNSAIEATGHLAWIDSAKRTGGLRFWELSAPAREQIRAWLGETSTASSGRNWPAFPPKRDKQPDDDTATEKPVIWQEVRGSSMQLVPIERHRAQTRCRFLLGVLVGFVICAVVMIPILYASGTKRGSPAQSSADHTRASVAQPVSPTAAVSPPTATKPLATEPASVQTVSEATPTWSPQRQSPHTAGTSSMDLMTRTSSPSATPQLAKADSSSGQVPHPKKVSATPQQLWSALQAGNTKAAVTLANHYTRGEGVPVNCEQARILLQVASEKNNAEAAKRLQEVDKGGCPQTASELNP